MNLNWDFWPFFYSFKNDFKLTGFYITQLLTSQHWLISSYFVAELFNKLVVSRNDSSLTLHTAAYNQTLNTVFLLNKEVFASVIHTRLVLKEKTYDAREHKGEVNWKLPYDDPMTSGGHQ